jgi:hypothetical protein
MGFTEVLTLIFVVLKGTGNLDWSWWQVFIPEYVAAGLWVLAILGASLGLFSFRKRASRW